MGTYLKNGILCANFNSERSEEYDLMGRGYVRDFFSIDPECSIFDNDRENGFIDYDKSDLRLEIFKQIFFIEAAVKSNRNFGFVSQGVDVEARKLKYYKSIILMFNKLFSDMLIIDGRCLLAAQNHSGKEYCGHYPVRSTPNFTMPASECYRLRKWCNENGEWELQDFYRIAYRHVPHLENKGGRWKQVNRKQCRVAIPSFISRVLQMYA